MYEIMSFIKKSFFYGLILFSSACHSSGVWNGTYIYSDTLGNTAGGSVITTNYKLTIDSSLCTLNIEGFQLEERIICDAESNDNVLSVKFKSYADGSAVNAFGVAIYKVNDTLFSLAKSKDLLITKWVAEKPDNNKSSEGLYFKLK